MLDLDDLPWIQGTDMQIDHYWNPEMEWDM
jgi:hypothetical protein